eukprot:g3621.t1
MVNGLWRMATACVLLFGALLVLPGQNEQVEALFGFGGSPAPQQFSFRNFFTGEWTLHRSDVDTAEDGSTRSGSAMGGRDDLPPDFDEDDDEDDDDDDDEVDNVLAGDSDDDEGDDDSSSTTAYYSIQRDEVSSALIGKYFELGVGGAIGVDSEQEHRNELSVQVEFKGMSETKGSFQTGAKADSMDDDDMVELNTLFDFDFRPAADGNFVMSQGKWHGKSESWYRFIIIDNKRFVLTVMPLQAPDTDASSITATTIVGIRTKAGEGQQPQERTFFQRYGMSLSLMFYFFAKRFLGGNGPSTSSGTGSSSAAASSASAATARTAEPTPAQRTPGSGAGLSKKQE